MPKKLPKQVAIELAVTRIRESSFEVVTPHETRTNARFTEGEWTARVNKFLKDPENDITNSTQMHEITTALLTKEYNNHLPKTLVDKLTKPLKTSTCKTKTIPVKKPEKIESVKRKMKKLEGK